MKKFIFLFLFSLTAFAQAPSLNQYGTRTSKIVPYPVNATQIDFGTGLKMTGVGHGITPSNVTTTQRLDIVSPNPGEIVYDTTIGAHYKWNGSAWVSLSNPPQTLAETLAEDNKTNDIPIVSNNGNAVVDVNDDYLQIGYEDSYGISGITFDSPSAMLLESFWAIGLNSLQIGLEAEVNVNIYTPDLTWNDDTIATQNWVTSQGYGTGTVTSVTGVGGETTVATGTTTPVIGISSTYTSARDAYADAKVANDLTASTTVAPSKTAVNTALDLKQDKLTSFNRQTASYTLALADANKVVEMNVASANNLTVPLDSSVAYPIGTIITVVQNGAGQTTIVATVGVTLRSANNWLKINARYGAVTLVKIGTDEWYVFGNLNA